jgi:hypothetical protein
MFRTLNAVKTPRLLVCITGILPGRVSSSVTASLEDAYHSGCNDYVFPLDMLCEQTGLTGFRVLSCRIFAIGSGTLNWMV